MIDVYMGRGQLCTFIRLAATKLTANMGMFSCRYMNNARI